ncbi:adenomatous polyposis coli protein [Platysternon megacephalum]|uniref:5-formyltetrahydrofolate cyclo-ligase n=1 Tax=Platysternon megacephalum TaxID=55544 RepID=A0A4D9ERH8_9SAUR|nr:adenomatous polyposis coli protein [Platysternon megacephalum]
MESRGEGPGPAGESSEMAAALRAAKQALRAELKRRLRALSEAEKQRQSRLLSRKVIGHSKYQESQRIAIFLSMQDEIETEEIIKDIFQRGKECFIPQYKPRSSHMDMVKLTSAEEISSLPLTSWNIHQPCDNDVREEALSGAKLSKVSAPQLPYNRSKWVKPKQPRPYLDPAQKPLSHTWIFREEVQPNGETGLPISHSFAATKPRETAAWNV